MSKVNHNRGFRANRFWLGQRRGPRYIVFGNGRATMEGEMVQAGSTASSESSRGVQRSRAGAKKFVHSRVRLRDHMACKKIVREGLTD